jgi:hypothetical protein
LDLVVLVFAWVVGVVPCEPRACAMLEAHVRVC